jgi:hypothetical protein
MCPRSLFVDIIKVSTKAIILTHTLGVHTVRTVRLRYFDHGLFEIKQVEWSSSTPRRVAVVAERSDHEAMNSNIYFVLIGNHVFSATELRHAYHSDDVIFAAAADCLSVSWSDPHHLVLDCRGGKIDAAHIDARKSIADDVAITYVNIADGTAKEFQPTP